jgi:hypothetical protein
MKIKKTILIVLILSLLVLVFSGCGGLVTPGISGYYNLLHKYSGKYVCTGDILNGGNIFIWGPIPAGHEDRYKFDFISTGDGYYNILHKYSGKYVCTGNTTDGGNIFIWGPIPEGHEDRYKFELISNP